MSDPLTALSVAAAVVQFVEFSTKLLSTGVGVYKSVSGVSEVNEEIGRHAENVQSLTNSVIAASVNAPLILSVQEKKIIALAKQCQDISRKLLDLLEDLKVKGKGARRVVAAARQSLRSMVHADRIENLQKALDRIRSDVNLGLSIVLRDDQASATRNLALLTNESRRIGTINALQLEHVKDDIIKAIENRAAQHPAQSQPAQVIADLTAKFEKLFQHHANMQRSLRILRRLTFPEIWDRQLNIADTYGDTGHWMYDPQRTPFRKWLSTGDGIFWISGKAGSGKSTLMRLLSRHHTTRDILQDAAGSVPVTIASFYFWNSGTERQKSQDGLLQSLLFQILRQCPDLIPIACPERWSPAKAQGDGVSTALTIADGPSLDLTEETVLSEPWTRQELRRTLSAIIHEPQVNRRFCFFIDGLDEYHGEHYALINDLRSFVKSSQLMLCVSSRPWNAFQDEYGTDKDLYVVLENETQDDMELYVKGTLGGHPRFAKLLDENAEAQDLVTDVRKRSQGIFLWVFLAVRSLIRGITEHDEITTLRQRLQQLPPELERLFATILDSVDPFYRRHQAQAILVVTHALEKPPILMFWLLQKLIEDPQLAFNMEVAAPGEDELQTMENEAKLRINSWCRDLLEVQSRYNVESPLPDDRTDGANRRRGDMDATYPHRVVFLHLSVREYLMTRDVQEDLIKKAGTSFNPCETLCHLHLALVTMTGSFDFVGACDLLMRHLRDLELIHQSVPVDMLDRLDYVGTKIMSELQRCLDFADSASCEDNSNPDDASSTHSAEPHLDVALPTRTLKGPLEGKRNAHWSNLACSTHVFDIESDFLAYTISYGLKSYLKSAIEHKSLQFAESKTPYLYFAFQRRCEQFYRSLWGAENGEGHDVGDDPPLSLIRTLLENGADPDQVLFPDCEGHGMATRQEGVKSRTVLQDYQLRHRDKERVTAVEELVARVQAERMALTKMKASESAKAIAALGDGYLWKAYSRGLGWPTKVLEVLTRPLRA